MSYRKIRVNNKLYKYTVGKTHVKIHGMDAVLKEKVGQWKPVRCSCCGEILDEDDTRIAVSPSDIRKYIEQVT